MAEHALVGASDFFNLFSSLEKITITVLYIIASRTNKPRKPPCRARALSQHRAPTPAANAVQCDRESSGYGPVRLARGGHGRLRVCANELERRNEPASPAMSARAVSDSGLRGAVLIPLSRRVGSCTRTDLNVCMLGEGTVSKVC